MFGLGGKYGAVSFLNILSPELSDEMLADFLNTENGIVVNLHVQAIDQSEAIKTVKRKITDLDAMKIQEQKRAVRSGYDMDILPSDLATYGQDAKELLKTLQSRNERMFQITFLVMNTADTRQKLENDVFWAAGVAQKYNCSLVRLDYQQEQGLMSSLPLGANHIKIERSLTTSSVAVFVPFVTQELFMGGDAMYYGVNAKTGNMIMLDRKRARCPNGLKLGTPGSGKSMSCKSEIVSVFLCTPDDVYICDPEAEYYPLVKRLHGQVVKLSPTSKSYAGGRRAPRFGNPINPRFHSGKAGADGICGTQRQTATSHQGRPQPCVRPAGCADFSPAHGGMGNQADGHCQGRGRPGGLHGGH